ncbi:MAG: ATP-grasp domain-containing protein [Desulfobacterales bacterium]|nr:ATP-grasp domain-containing protein [Desulfobacterales bacterium]
MVIVSSKMAAVRHWRTAKKYGQTIVLQEYVPHHEGEFSLGVLSLPMHGVVGSIALKKIFESKFSLHSKSHVGVVSSPYSSGLIEEFIELRMYSESIARAVGSVGPMNIQGRIRNGTFLPFEINPRFSGSEYVRTMAGFNQLDIYLTYLRTGEIKKMMPYHKGYYLRSLAEMYVPLEKVKL